MATFGFSYGKSAAEWNILLEWIHFYDKTKNYLKISCENSKCFGESNLKDNFNDLDINKPALLWKW